MANWCSNTVEFIGEHSQFEELTSFFDSMQKKQRKDGKGQLPDFEINGTGYLFGIRWEYGVLYYETKWSPNVNVIVAIAEHFKMGFIYRYIEPGNCICGEAGYKDGILTDVALDQDDLALYEYCDDDHTYYFENQRYEISDDILEILLERKKAVEALKNFSPDNSN